MTDADSLLAAWRRTYAELFPGRPAERMRFDDATLALAVTLERQFRRAPEEGVAPAVNLRVRMPDRQASDSPEGPE